MVSLLLVAAATAAPVVCDADGAAKLLAEARIEEARAPVSHPELIPGLALASAKTDPNLKSLLVDLCEGGGALSLVAAESWQAADWSAHTFLLTRADLRGCTLGEQTIAISVGVRDGATPRYGLRSGMRFSRTPVGDCASVPRYREERVLDGADGPVRLVLLTDHEGSKVVHAAVAVRAASSEGWTEQVLLDPAPARVVDGGAGPTVELTDRYEQKWVVAHGDRSGTPPDCRALSGQTVWTQKEGWTSHTGQAALRLLAERGLWRMAGQDGWFVIVGQDDEEDEVRLRARARRMADRTGEELLVLQSAWFPGLNPGFWVVVLPPFASEAEAKAASARWRPRRQAYVKRAWQAADPCV
jgi:hypothetical protein